MNIIHLAHVGFRLLEEEYDQVFAFKVDAGLVLGMDEQALRLVDFFDEEDLVVLGVLWVLMVVSKGAIRWDEVFGGAGHSNAFDLPEVDYLHKV